MKYKKITFPQDEQAHDNIIEWWYFNGNLKDAKGNKYAFMDCLFKVDVNRVNIPFLKLPFKTAYFSHSLLSDIKNNKFYPEVNPLSVISTDSFSKSLLFINYANPSLEGYTNYVIENIEKSKYHIKTSDIDLILTSTKKPLLEGGKGFVDLNPDKTYYYSLTSLKTKGRIRIRGNWIEVTGKSWMDHQWADVPYNENRWTWFSIQLRNSTEIVCFEYDDGKNKTNLASISYPDNRQNHVSDVIFNPLKNKWRSNKTGTTYPLSWETSIPSENIALSVEPLISHQEINFGTINYWEGPIKVKGEINKKKVEGEGFMELVGYPSDYTKIRFLRDETARIIKISSSYITNEIKKRKVVSDIIKKIERIK
ncbi:MAG: lipocalin family protein [Nitrospinota bacterium]